MSDEVYAAINPLAGYPLTILIILRSEMIVTHDRLLELTDLSLPTIRKHLQKLIKLGYVENVGDYHKPMYRLLEKATELYFMDMLSEKFLQIEHTTTIYINNLNKEKEDIKSSSTGTSEKLLQIDEEAYQVARDYGVGKGMANKIAAEPYATPEYCKAHFEYAKQNEEKVGMAIRRILDEDPKPKIEEACPICGRAEFMVQGECIEGTCRNERQRKRYKTSKYSSYVRKQ
jgi:hypothetical protein